MKTLLTGFLVSVISFVYAGELDSYKASDVLKMPADQLEKLYLLDQCPHPNCEFNKHSLNPYDLPKVEALAIWRYTGGDYKYLNKALYEGKLEGAEAAHLRILDSALAKIPSQKLTVYRGASKKAKVKVGEVMFFKGYTSTSLDQNIAESFVKRNGYLMIINVNSGKDIMEYSNLADEKEMLLPRNLKFRIDQISTTEIMMNSGDFDDRFEAKKPVNIKTLHLSEI
jgi:hypothetical protein